MKTLKNDTRYIIKRVLIGVLIAIVLFNARKCGVYAETRDLYVWGNNQAGAYINSSSAPSTGYTLMCETTLNDINFHIYYYNAGARYFNSCYVFLFQNPNDTSQYTLQYILYDMGELNYTAITDNSYIDFSFTYSPSNTSGIISTPPNYYFRNVNSNIVSGGYFNSATTGTNIVYGTKYGFVQFNDSMFDNSQHYLSEVNTGLNNNKSFIYSVYNNYTLYSNSEIPVKINDSTTIFEPPSSFPPTGYQEINLKDYQGVVLVPKNYNDIECSEVGDLCNTTFTYYYQEEIKEAYFPIDNHFNIRFNSDILNSPGEPTEKETYFPLIQEITENSDGNVGRLYNIYYAFLIYNYTNDGSPLDPNNYQAYGSAKIWVDTTKWNYYLVDDFNTWSEQICYYVGSTEICTDISGLPTLREAIEQAEAENYIDPYNGNFLNALFDLLTAPFRIIKEFGSTQCEPLTLPLRFPTADQDIVIQCLSPKYKETFGEFHYNQIGMIIMAILWYKLALYIIDNVTDLLDPQDDKLEAVDL